MVQLCEHAGCLADGAQRVHVTAELLQMKELMNIIRGRGQRKDGHVGTRLS
jgi:hypothetical protein